MQSEIADRLLSEEKLSKGVHQLPSADIDRLRSATSSYFSAEVLERIARSNLFRIPTHEEAALLVKLQEALREKREEEAAALLTQISCPVVEKNVVQKQFKKNNSDEAIVIVRDEGSRNIALALNSAELKAFEDAAKKKANSIMIIYPGNYGGINAQGLFIYGMDEGVLSQNFAYVDGDTWQTKPHSLVFATAPGEYYATSIDQIPTMQSHEGKQNAKPYQFYCHDDLRNPAKAYNADPERFAPVNNDARLLFEILHSAPAQLVRELRSKIEDQIK